MNRLLLSALLALLASRTTTAVYATDQVFTVTGVVRGLLDDGKLIIEHDDIPGYMPSMTMAFSVKHAAAAPHLENGDRIRFRFRVSETSSSAEDIAVTGRETTVPTKVTTASTKNPRLREGDQVPSFQLVDESDHPFAAENLLNHATVVTFVFTRCPVPEYCPAMAFRFAQLQRAILADSGLANRARLLSITLDPEFDRPAILKAYGQAVGADPKIWQFATGDKVEVARLTKAFAVYTEQNGVTLDHTLCTALIDREGRVAALWRGNGWKAEEVIGALVRAAND